VALKTSIFLWFLCISLTGCEGWHTGDGEKQTHSLDIGTPVSGWNILSDREEDARTVIAAAGEYNINHLQLSHEIVHDLREVRSGGKRELVKRLVRKAHQSGIQEVTLWDHALYDLDYYPAQFRSGPDSTIDLDDRVFWDWFKQDYRAMLDLVPGIGGLVLTFIETGARAERQYSQRLATPQEKLAAVVNAVADVVIGERGLNLYARTFAYTYEEYDNIVGAVELFERPEIRLMMKETPHDFFLTHPNDFFAGTIDRPTLMEFDIAGEFNGQGLIANTWPEYVLDRWSDFLERDHIIGYVARTDRYGDTRIVGRPSEINLLVLQRYFEDRSVTADDIYESFIVDRYGRAAYPLVKAAFQNAYDIVTSTLYTLGTNVANHSRLDFDPYRSSYARHVSGKWLDPPVVTIGHGINRTFHYWTDVIDCIAPAWAKRPGGAHLEEISWVVENGWLHEEEKMDETCLGYILTEKAHGVTLAQTSLSFIEEAKPHLTEEAYLDLYHYYQRTLLTARLYRSVAGAYYGFRVYGRGESFRTLTLMTTVRESLRDIREVAQAIRDYPEKPAAGQWNWVEDADTAMAYYEWMTTTGWPAETRGFVNPYGGLTFQME